MVKGLEAINNVIEKRLENGVIQDDYPGCIGCCEMVFRGRVHRKIIWDYERYANPRKG